MHIRVIERLSRYRMNILKIFEDVRKFCVMVYEIEYDKVVLSKEGTYEYIQNDIEYLFPT